MFGTMKRGVNAYASVSLETSVASASPHKLVVMLYDGALVAVMSGLMHMRAGNIPEKGKSISHAITIIDSGLRASLDKTAGGEIAEGLDALYKYMNARLLQANIHNDTAALEEVQRLLTDLRETWNAIGTPAPAASPSDMKSLRPATLMSA